MHTLDDIMCHLSLSCDSHKSAECAHHMSVQARSPAIRALACRCILTASVVIAMVCFDHRFVGCVTTSLLFQSFHSFSILIYLPAVHSDCSKNSTAPDVTWLQSKMASLCPALEAFAVKIKLADVLVKMAELPTLHALLYEVRSGELPNLASPAYEFLLCHIGANACICKC